MGFAEAAKWFASKFEGPEGVLTLHMSDSARQRVLRLQSLAKVDSMSELLRMSLATYEALIEHQSSGGTVVLKTPDEGGVDKRLILSPAASMED